MFGEELDNYRDYLKRLGIHMHSRKSMGQKETTDINSLADEYLRLSYHGLRAKDKSFNATMKTGFDGSIAVTCLMNLWNRFVLIHNGAFCETKQINLIKRL